MAALDVTPTAVSIPPASIVLANSAVVPVVAALDVMPAEVTVLAYCAVVPVVAPVDVTPTAVTVLAY